MANELQDTLLLAKLCSGDMIVMDAVYHKHCLTALFTRYRSSIWQSVLDEKLTCEAIALAELISYIEEIRKTDESIVKLSDVVHLRLEQLGGDTSKRINATHLKDKLFAQIPDLEAHKSNFNVILSFKTSTDIGETLLEATKRNHDSDAVVLMWAAGIVRKEIFQKHYKFQGSLLDEQYDDNPSSLIALIQMILGGTKIENQTENSKDS